MTIDAVKLLLVQGYLISVVATLIVGIVKEVLNL